jgi:hypothetical protein
VRDEETLLAAEEALAQVEWSASGRCHLCGGRPKEDAKDLGGGHEEGCRFLDADWRLAEAAPVLARALLA